jgi:hypothetical protein
MASDPFCGEASGSVDVHLNVVGSTLFCAKQTGMASPEKSNRALSEQDRSFIIKLSLFYFKHSNHERSQRAGFGLQNNSGQKSSADRGVLGKSGFHKFSKQ